MKKRATKRRKKIKQVEIENPYRFDLPNNEALVNGVKQIIRKEKNQDAYSISIVFVDNPFIIRLNKRYFDKSTPTDVISFNYQEQRLEGEIYISVEQAASQAHQYDCTLEEELCRLIVHGTLHLLNYTDNSAQDEEKMSELEDKYLNLFFKSIS